MSTISPTSSETLKAYVPSDRIAAVIILKVVECECKPVRNGTVCNVNCVNDDDERVRIVAWNAQAVELGNAKFIGYLVRFQHLEIEEVRKDKEKFHFGRLPYFFKYTLHSTFQLLEKNYVIRVEPTPWVKVNIYDPSHKYRVKALIRENFVVYKTHGLFGKIAPLGSTGVVVSVTINYVPGVLRGFFTTDKKICIGGTFSSDPSPTGRKISMSVYDYKDVKWLTTLFGEVDISSEAATKDDELASREAVTIGAEEPENSSDPVSSLSVKHTDDHLDGSTEVAVDSKIVDTCTEITATICEQFEWNSAENAFHGVVLVGDVFDPIEIINVVIPKDLVDFDVNKPHSTARKFYGLVTVQDGQKVLTVTPKTLDDNGKHCSDRSYSSISTLEKKSSVGSIHRVRGSILGPLKVVDGGKNALGALFIRESAVKRLHLTIVLHQPSLDVTVQWIAGNEVDIRGTLIVKENKRLGLEVRLFEHVRFFDSAPHAVKNETSTSGVDESAASLPLLKKIKQEKPDDFPLRKVKIERFSPVSFERNVEVSLETKEVEVITLSDDEEDNCQAVIVSNDSEVDKENSSLKSPHGRLDILSAAVENVFGPETDETVVADEANGSVTTSPLRNDSAFSLTFTDDSTSSGSLMRGNKALTTEKLRGKRQTVRRPGSSMKKAKVDTSSL